MKNGTLIGISEVDITPDFVTELAGYNDAIPRESEGVHDEISAKAISIENNDCTVVILSVPAVNIKIDSFEIIRSATSIALNIPKQNILIHATHSHSCPKNKGEYKSFLEKKCIQCIEESFKNRFYGKIGFGKTTVNECGKNRRRLLYGGLPVDPEIIVMKIEDENGCCKAIVYNYACHCTVMGVDNKLISEDWPFFANTLITQTKGNNIKSIFIQGASGDINPGYSAGLSAVGANIPTRTWSEAKRIGENVGNALLEIVDTIVAEEIIKLKSSTIEFTLPARKDYPTSLEQAKNNYEQAKLKLEQIKTASNASEIKIDKAKTELFFASLIKNGAQDFYNGKWAENLKIEVQAICINNNIITSSPCEMFCEDGMALKKKSPAKYTMIAELSNPVEAIDYIPTANAYKDGDYEVYCSRYHQDAASILIDESLNNINKIYKE